MTQFCVQKLQELKTTDLVTELSELASFSEAKRQRGSTAVKLWTVKFFKKSSINIDIVTILLIADGVLDL